jgi:hypothetical protein
LLSPLLSDHFLLTQRPSNHSAWTSVVQVAELQLRSDEQIGCIVFAMTAKEDGVEVRELSEQESWELLEKAAQRELGMSAKDFLVAWDTGNFDKDPDRPELMRVVMLLPLIRSK